MRAQTSRIARWKRFGPAVRLVRAALTGRLPHERRAAVDLLRVHDHWAAGLLLRVALHGDVEVAARAELALRGSAARYNRVFTKPTRDQVAGYGATAGAVPGDSQLGLLLRELVLGLESRVRAR